MKRLIGSCLAMTLIACASAPAASTEMQADAEARCVAEASGEWLGSGERKFAVTANTSGPTCARSVALLIVRDEEGDVVWTDARPTAHVMGLHTPTTRSAMSPALAEWVHFASQRPQTTADLPPWPQTAGHATESEFPFYPEEWIDEETYVRLSAQRTPMFCYIQGMESLACLIEFDDRLEKIGVQSFPG